MNQSTNRKAKNWALPNYVKQENDLKVNRKKAELWMPGIELVYRVTSRDDRG